MYCTAGNRILWGVVQHPIFGSNRDSDLAELQHKAGGSLFGPQTLDHQAMVWSQE